jgi:DNA-directed RNA polymerase specialized sigma subunit
MTTMNLQRSRRTKVVKRRIPQIAEERGMTAKQLLESLYEKYGNQTEIAKELGVAQSTISLEFLRLGIQGK